MVSYSVLPTTNLVFLLGTILFLLLLGVQAFVPSAHRSPTSSSTSTATTIPTDVDTLTSRTTTSLYGRTKRSNQSCYSSSHNNSRRRHKTYLCALKESSTDNNDKFSSSDAIELSSSISSSSSSQFDQSDKSTDDGTQPTAADDVDDGGMAVTNTINERLMAELQEAEDKEKYGAKSGAGKKYGLVDGFGRTRKTDEEIQAAIEEARDLNGVNPLVALTGGVFALVAAAILWWSTGLLGTWFATHPPQTDVYFVQRASQVVRNIAMGLFSLASGFFGVTGVGIFLLGVRVAYGVMVGVLDPTPIKPSAAAAAAAKEKQDAVDFGNIMGLMMNKKPNRRGNNDSRKP